ncbi:DNA replication factor C large subunit [Epithele typhae]|uniref:DNA replication factor C large subunit n=1 Tax=Epithele typhae TaxID=378194 RepID=UPI00200766CA|nr:DNA replication factor C large subunit [Epithele typhae]KAH9936826.1 DNA replication factor C large subunit [Epithele typhae]
MSSKAKVPVKSHGSDIRGFFAKGSGSSTPQPSRGPAAGKLKTLAIDISEDEGESSKKKPGVAKPTKATPSKPAPAKPTPAKPGPSKTRSERAMEVDSDSDVPKRTAPKRKARVVESSDEDEETGTPPKKKQVVSAVPPPKPRPSTSEPKQQPAARRPLSPRKAVAAATARKKKAQDDDFIVSDDHVDDDDDQDDDFEMDDEEEGSKKSKSKTKPPAKKPPAKAVPAKSTAAKATPTKSAPAKKKTEEKKPAKPAENSSAKTEDKSAAKSEGKSEEKPAKKPNWIAMKAGRAGPSDPGSKEIPIPEDPNCLAGLSFVFTGELSSLSRDEAIELAKRYGGRVVGQPSTKTSYVVVGSDAGPSKLKAIEKNKLKTLDEDGFLNLIATRKTDESMLDDKTRKKMQKEDEAIRQSAKEMDMREKRAAKAAASGSAVSKPDLGSQLWTDRYAPQSLKEICGNKGQIEKLQGWLNAFAASMKSDFKKPGKDAMGIFRAVMITGPPGIGKTTSAHLCAKLAGYTPIELNASDARSKKLVENSTNIMNTSLDGWMGGGTKTNAAGVAITEKSCLIMDEVDGMSAGDRGGVVALVALIKKSKVPIICIANDRGAQKLKPLTASTFNLTFKRPEAAAIRSRILSIAFKEKMKIPANVIDQLVQGAQSDIRQVLNMLATWRLSSASMDFDEGKAMVKMNEKYAVMTPFGVINKMLGPQMFSPTARETLGDKMELYFHDPSFVPLFMQENYLKTQPHRVRNVEGPEKTLKHLELMDKAARSLSDSDIVDSLIHGPNQYWSLMPLHAVCSTVRPASFLYGMGAGYGGPNAMSFPQWLGQNSKQNSLQRQLTDIQARMRLRVSGDKSEIRQSYIPALFPHLVQPLMEKGASAVDDTIEFMDGYFISHDDWDTLVKLGVGAQAEAAVLKQISTATKSAFTRNYNARDHPLAFHKAEALGKPPKRLAAAGAAPDLEEAFDVEDEVPADEEKEEADDGLDNDKLIKASKGKGKGKAVAVVAKGKGKVTKK